MSSIRTLQQHKQKMGTLESSQHLIPVHPGKMRLLHISGAEEHFTCSDCSCRTSFAYLYISFIRHFPLPAHYYTSYCYCVNNAPNHALTLATSAPPPLVIHPYFFPLGLRPLIICVAAVAAGAAECASVAGIVVLLLV